MKKQLSEEETIVWKEQKRVMTLQSVPVLEISMAWPEWTGRGALGKSAGRYYQKLVSAWKKRWEREIYLCACCALAQCREETRNFSCWRAALGGSVTEDGEEYLSIAMWAREDRGEGRVLEHRWGDTWRKGDGMPVTLKEVFVGEKHWRRQVKRNLRGAAQTCREQGVFLDDGAEQKLLRWFSPEAFSLYPDRLEFYFPQCAVAPAVEGAVSLSVPRPGKGA